VNAWQARLAVRVLQQGGLVAHATEGVWGLACDPWDAKAVRGLLALKSRSASKGLIVIGADAADFRCELEELTADDRQRVAASWPGPVTWILPNRRFPTWITGSRDSVAVRVPGHPQARALCRAFGGPLVSTSANRTGLPPPGTHLQLRRRLTDAQRHTRAPGAPGLLYVLPGETSGRRAPSEIRTLAGARFRRAS
jgi:L-threonylcarbamoyladenylate synthase